MKQPATRSGRAEGTSYHGRQPDQQVDQSAGDALNESAKMEGNVDWRWKADPCPVMGRPEAAAQQVRRGGQLESSEEDGWSR
jgi:hypothetical protein